MLLSFLSLYLTLGAYIFILRSNLGSSIMRLFNTVKEKVEKSNIQCVPSMLLSFMVRLVAIFGSLQLIWRRQNNIHPSNVLENNTNSQPPAVEAVNEEDRVLPCIERLQKLEKVYEELSNKPAAIPLEKEQMLMESLQRIKSVESDLEKTKRVRSILLGLDDWKLNSWIHKMLTLAFVFLWQVLHATVVKQHEIAELLEKLRESKFHVSFFT